MPDLSEGLMGGASGDPCRRPANDMFAAYPVPLRTIPPTPDHCASGGTGPRCHLLAAYRIERDDEPSQPHRLWPFSQPKRDPL
jgi:hypothetical protein